jgi:MtN3 and saliva related transmembrane protein
MQTPDIIASIAAFFTMIGYLPQAIKTIKTRDTKSISFWMYLLSLIGVIFWLIYGLMINSYPIILKNIAVIILSGTILFIKIGNMIKKKEDVKESKIITHSKFFRKIFGLGKYKNYQ